jgi:hypothetical protein
VEVSRVQKTEASMGHLGCCVVVRSRINLLMDTDKNGKISKQEWMKFMEAEFDRLDKDKSGDLDVKDLGQSKLRVSHFTNVGK